MTSFKRLLFLAGAAGLSNVALTVINILQAGPRTPDGRSMAQILGVDPQKATLADVEKLGRADTMQLFYAAPAPDFSAMKGEYRAQVLKGGVLGSASILFTHHVFPTGRITLDTHWEGKAFMPVDKTSGHGYNLFATGPSRSIFRARKFKTSLAPTIIGKDGRNALHLDYCHYNSGVIHSMHDEVRQINAELFICAGCMALGGGPVNPAPFVLLGTPTDWVGLKE